MAIPKSNDIMLPLLKFLEDGERHTNREVLRHLALYFNLSREEISRRPRKGDDSYFESKVRKAKYILSYAKLVRMPNNSNVIITDRGLAVLSENIDKITFKYLKRFKEFSDYLEFRKRDDELKKAYFGKNRAKVSAIFRLMNW